MYLSFSMVNIRCLMKITEQDFLRIHNIIVDDVTSPVVEIIEIFGPIERT